MSFSRLAFTLVELLVAMAITLLMLAALARAFGFVGERIRDSRTEVKLTNELRDITTRLSDELSQRTASLTPVLDGGEQLGYFVYYEGPLTDSTSSLFRVSTGATGNIDLDDAKYGDFDDYLAFTAAAKGDSWFTGKVPRFVLDQKTAELNELDYADPAVQASFPGNPWDPITIRSKYAEIIYFASPEYATQVTVSGQVNYLNLNNPSYLDLDGDTDLGSGAAVENGFPDKLNLHRRVLLIRPDLNLVAGAIPSRTFDLDLDPTNVSNQTFMLPDTWPNATTGTVTASAVTTNGWLYGMAGVHQQCDLSLRRVLSTVNGLPINAVAANSLEDLALPHNRFAHVRVPANVAGFGNGNVPTTMPLLALGSPPTILNALNDGNPATTPSPALRIAPPVAPATSLSDAERAVITPNQLCGFLRPEFVLGNDLTHIDSPLDEWGQSRRGEDLLANNSLGFDVQIYDPEASFFNTNSNPNADGNFVVGPSDAGYREAVLASVAFSPPGGATTPNFDGVLINPRLRGGFVDLCYPVLAGGALRGWEPRLLDRRSAAVGSRINQISELTVRGSDFLVTPFSGVRLFRSGAGVEVARASNAYSDCLYASGRVVSTGGVPDNASPPTIGQGAVNRIFQPAFDTFTGFYESDGFLQARTATTVIGATSQPVKGSLWTTINATASPLLVDTGANGVDEDGFFGPDDIGERETCPPFLATPEAVRVSIRLENPQTRLIRQASVTHSSR